MENASKALIIAGEVLIGIMVLTLMIYIFSAFGNFSSNMHESMVKSQIAQFNENFFTYENRTIITATEIVTIINFAKQSNDSRELTRNERTSEYYVRVFIDDVDVFNNTKYISNDYDYNEGLTEVLNNFIKNNNTSYFSCNASLEKKGDNLQVNYDKYTNDIVVQEKTGLVNEIHFHKIDENIISIPKSF